MALFPREGGFHREEVRKLPSSSLDFLVSLDQQTENGVNFKYQGKMKLLLHSGGKEAMNGARGIMSDAFWFFQVQKQWNSIVSKGMTTKDFEPPEFVILVSPLDQESRPGGVLAKGKMTGNGQ